MLFNRKNAHVSSKLIGVLGKINTTLNDSSLSTKEFKKQLGQKIVTIKWIVEQQINCLENASMDRTFLDRWLQRELKKPQKDLKVIANIEHFQRTIDETRRQARWVIANIGDELEQLLLAYGELASPHEFAQLINANITECKNKKDLLINVDRDTTIEEWNSMLDYLFLGWVLDNQNRPFYSNPLSYALWESNIKKLRESDKLSTICIVGERIAADNLSCSAPTYGQGTDYNT